jgi:hypothetical protein
MNGDEVPSLPIDVAELVASGRRLDGPAGDVRDRLRARLMATLPVPPSPGSGSSGDGGGAGGGGMSPSSWARAPWWVVAAALVVGGFAGRLTSTSSAPARGVSSAEARVEREAPVVASGSPSADRTSPGEVPPGATAPSAPSDSSTGAARPIAAVGSERSSGNLAAERRVLDVARTALGRGNGVDALAACEEHARRFPHGLLAEEREALAVQSLVEGKRFSEARARGDRFRQSYPKSILLPAVLAAIEVDR